MRRAAGTAIAVLVSGMVTFSQAPSSQAPSERAIQQIRGLDAPEGIDLAGDWVSAQWTEGGGAGNANDRRTFDYLGVPLTEAAQAWALSHTEEQISEPERQCGFYTPMYFVYGFMNVTMWREVELRRGSTVAWVVGGTLDTVPMVIWMDGRPHPSKNAPHSVAGFTTGVWENDVLVTTTTHMTAGLLHRRSPHSDLATMTLRYSRHGDILTLTGRIDDPVYLAEPLHVSKEFTLSPTPLNRAAVPCTVAYEGIPTGKVPRYLPGQNPFVDEMTKTWGIPVEAVKGGPETMYPDYRKKIKDTYVRPAKVPCGATREAFVCK